MLLRHRGLKPADGIRKDMVEALQAGLGRQGRIKPATRAGELAVNVMAGSERRNELTSFIVPRDSLSREGPHSTVGWSSISSYCT